MSYPIYVALADNLRLTYISERQVIEMWYVDYLVLALPEAEMLEILRKMASASPWLTRVSELAKKARNQANEQLR
jgi:hypothetical protein